MARGKDGSIVLLFNDNNRKKVFMVLRSDVPVWALTGGGIEAGETPEQAAVREAFEETGFKVKIIKKIGVYNIFRSGKYDAKAHLFEGRKISGNFTPEFVGCKGDWFEIDNLPKSTTRLTKIRINDALNSSKEVFEKNVDVNFIKDNFSVFLHHPFKSIKFLLKNKRA